MVLFLLLNIALDCAATSAGALVATFAILRNLVEERRWIV